MHLHVHEKVESLLLASVENLPKGDALRNLAVDFEKLHDALWILMRPVMEAFDSGDLPTMERAFQDFDAILRAHLMSEEEVLFPKIRAALPADELKRMEKDAEELARLYHPSLAA